MIKKNTKYVLVVMVALFAFVHVDAQVKIGDNHETINAGSLLELESLDKGFLFPRLSLDNDLSVWKLNGNDPVDGMVIFNINGEVNYTGLYCWYNDQWNLFANSGNIIEFDTLNFNSETRSLYDDADSVVISSGRVSYVDSIDVLAQKLAEGEMLEGDIVYVAGEGVYVKNNSESTVVAESFFFISAISQPGNILYATYASSDITPETEDFQLGVTQTYYTEPDTSTIISVDPPSMSGNKGYYSFAVPNTWADPRIFLKVKESGDNGYYQLNDCWVVNRSMEYEGVLYQVWTLDTPLSDSVMDIVGSKAQFMIE